MSVAALSQEKEVPFIGPSALLPQRGLPLNRYVFYLLPGLKEQARTLVSFAAKKRIHKNRAWRSYVRMLTSAEHIAKSIEDQGKKLGWSPVTGIYYPRERFNAAQYVTELKQQGNRHGVLSRFRR